MPGIQLRASLVWLSVVVVSSTRQVDDCMKVVSGAAPASSAKDREQKILASCKLNRPQSGILEHDAEKDCAQLIGLWKTAVHYQPDVSVQGFCNTLKDFAPPGHPLTPPMSSVKNASKVSVPKPSEHLPTQDDSATSFGDLVAQAAQSTTQPGDETQNDTLAVSMADHLETETPPPKTGKSAELDELLFVDSCVQYATTVEGRIRKHEGLADRILQSCEDHLPSEESFCHGYVSLIRRHAKHPELVRFCGSGYQLMQAAGTLPTSTEGMWGPAQANDSKDDDVTQADEAAQLPDGIPPDPVTALTAPAESVSGVTDDALLGESSQVAASSDPTADAEAAMVDAAGSTLAGSSDITDPASASDSVDVTQLVDPTDPLAQVPTDDGFSSEASSDGPTAESLTAFESTTTAQDLSTDAVTGVDAASQSNPIPTASTDSAIDSTALLDESSSGAETSSPDPQSVLDEAASILNDGHPTNAPPANDPSAKVPPPNVHRQTYLAKITQTRSAHEMKHKVASNLQAPHVTKPVSKEAAHTKHGISKFRKVATAAARRSSYVALSRHQEHSAYQSVNKATRKQAQLKHAAMKNSHQVLSTGSNKKQKSAVIASEKGNQKAVKEAPVSRTAPIAKERQLEHVQVSKKEAVKEASVSRTAQPAPIAKERQVEHVQVSKKEPVQANVKPHASTQQKHAAHAEPLAAKKHHHGADVSISLSPSHGANVKPAVKTQHKLTLQAAPSPKTELQREGAHPKLTGHGNHKHENVPTSKPAPTEHHDKVHQQRDAKASEAKKHPTMIASHTSKTAKAHHLHGSGSAVAGKAAIAHPSSKSQSKDRKNTPQHPSFIADSDLGKSFEQVLKDHAKRRAELLAKSSARAIARQSHARRLHESKHKTPATNSKRQKTHFEKSHHSSPSSAHAAKAVAQPVAHGLSLSQSHGTEKSHHSSPPSAHAAKAVVQPVAHGLSLSQSHGTEKISTADLFGDASDLFGDEAIPKQLHTVVQEFAMNHREPAAPQASLISEKTPRTVSASAHKVVQEARKPDARGHSTERKNNPSTPPAQQTSLVSVKTPKIAFSDAHAEKAFLDVSEKAHAENPFGDDIFGDELTSKPKSARVSRSPQKNHAKQVERRTSLVSPRPPKVAQKANHHSSHIAKARAVQDPSSSSQVNSFFEEFVSNWRGEAPQHRAKSSVQRSVGGKEQKHVKRAARLSLVQAQAPRSWRVHRLPMTAADEFFEGFVSRYGSQIDTGVSDGGVSRGQHGMSLIGSESSISHAKKSRPTRNKKAMDAFLDGFKDRYMPEDRDLDGKEPPRPAVISAEAQGKVLLSEASSSDIFADSDDAASAESFLPPYRPGGSQAAWQAFTRAAIV